MTNFQPLEAEEMQEAENEEKCEDDGKPGGNVVQDKGQKNGKEGACEKEKVVGDKEDEGIKDGLEKEKEVVEVEEDDTVTTEQEIEEVE